MQPKVETTKIITFSAQLQKVLLQAVDQDHPLEMTMRGFLVLALLCSITIREIAATQKTNVNIHNNYHVTSKKKPNANLHFACK